MKQPKLEENPSPSNIKSDNIKKAVKGVIKFASENPHLQNNLFNEEFPIFLQINSFKIPRAVGPVKQVFRIPLTNSPLPSDADVCLIVPDVKGIPNKEHERHLDHYETVLRAKDVTGIKKIMTFHEFRTEYDTFELKSRLADLYDLFLVDGKISGKVVHKCGSIFYKKKKVPVAVKLHLPKLKSHIEQSLKKTFFQINLKSDSHSVQIGNSKMKTKSLIENIYNVVEFIEKQFPGKMDNIRSLNVYAHRGSSVPIYVSLKNPNEVKVPKLSIKKPKAYKSFTGELTTQYNANVVVKPSGHVVVRRSKKKGELIDPNEDNTITDAEIIQENRNMDKTEGDNDGNKTMKGKKRKHSETQDTTRHSTASGKKNTSKEGLQKAKKAKKQNSKEITAVQGQYVKVKKEENNKTYKKVIKKNFKKGNKIEKNGNKKNVKSRFKKKSFTS